MTYRVHKKRRKKQKLFEFIPEKVRQYFRENDAEVIRLNFPILKTPEKVKSLNLRKTPKYTGKQKGIKGQYLIFEDNTVFNIRANEGLVVGISVN